MIEPATKGMMVEVAEYYESLAFRNCQREAPNVD
jgi:hypothetical protein